MTERIVWKSNQASPQFLGGQGYKDCCGIEIYSPPLKTPFHSIELAPFDQNGKLGACMIQIPMSEIDNLIAILKDLKKQT